MCERLGGRQVEPGLYFNDFQFQKGYSNPAQRPFLVKERIDSLMDFGGVRIEGAAPFPTPASARAYRLGPPPH
jgi:hypothetical protein